MSERSTTEIPKHTIFAFLHLTKFHLQNRATLKNNVSVFRAAIDRENPLRDLATACPRIPSRALGGTHEGAACLKILTRSSTLTPENAEMAPSGRPLVKLFMLASIPRLGRARLDL